MNAEGLDLNFDSEDRLQAAIAGTGIAGPGYRRDLIEHATSNSFVRIKVAGMPDRQLVWHPVEVGSDEGELQLVEIPPR